MSLQDSLPGRIRAHFALDLLPGLLLTAMLASLAFALRGLPLLGVFSPMILAILLGMVFHNVIGTPARAHPGIAFSMRRLLRLGIILLGLQLTAAQVAAVGYGGVAIIAAPVFARGRPVNGLVVMGVAEQLRRIGFKAIGQRLRVEAAEMSEALAGVD